MKIPTKYFVTKCEKLGAMEITFLRGFRNNLQMDRLKIQEGILNTECVPTSGRGKP